MEYKLLSICAALALGDVLGLAANGFGALWFVIAILALFTVLLGYGMRWRGWPLLAVFFLGLMLGCLHTQTLEHDYRYRFWKRSGEMRQHGKLAPKSTFPAIRATLDKRLTIGLDPQGIPAELNRALFLGERTGLPRAFKKAFVEAGTIHIFAISGLHVMLISYILALLTLFIGVPYRFAGALSLLPLWCYILAIGSPPSAVRAGLMAAFYWTAPLFYRRPNGLCAWGLTFLSVHLVKPAVLVDIGNGLSFTVMLSILLWLRLSKNLAKNGLVSTLGVSFAAWLGGVPIAAHVFSRVTPGCLLANLILMPTVELSVLFGTLGVVCSFISERIAAHLNNLAALLTESMAGVSFAVSRLPGANLDVPRWNLFVCAEWYVFVALFFWLVFKQSQRKTYI